MIESFFTLLFCVNLFAAYLRYEDREYKTGMFLSFAAGFILFALIAEIMS